MNKQITTTTSTTTTTTNNANKTKTWQKQHEYMNKTTTPTTNKNRANKSKTWPKQQAYHKENDEIQENQNSPKIEGPTKQHFQGSRVQGVRVLRRIEIVSLPSWRKPRKATNKQKQQRRTFLFLNTVKHGEWPNRIFALLAKTPQTH